MVEKIEVVFSDGEVREYDFPTADEMREQYEEMKRLTGMDPDSWDLTGP